MNQEEQERGNILIAEFMGMKWNTITMPGSNHYFKQWECKTDNPLYEKAHGTEHLWFHSSWDWLMPVIRQIKYGNPFTNTVYVVSNELSHESNRRFKAIENELRNLNITGTWFCVVQFIKWYNIQTINPFS